MRILLLSHSFNSLTQRLFVELDEAGHDVSLELDINDDVTREAVRLHAPTLVIAPYLRRAIPADVWRAVTCIVLHPGVRGDRGASSLDWAILEGEARWGVTALQADAELDAGDVWASVEFPMRPARKSSLYRGEVTEAAVQATRQVLERLSEPGFSPRPLDYADPDVRGRPRPRMRQRHRRIDWADDDTATAMRKLRAADSAPGVLDRVLDQAVYLFDAHAAAGRRGAPGQIIARRGGAICRATADGAVWIGHMKRRIRGQRTFKLPSTLALKGRLDSVPEASPGDQDGGAPRREITYREDGAVGYLGFDFYNGAMGTDQCRRLLEAYRRARRRPTAVIVLTGGRDLWSNGIHLNLIEHANSPADESLRNIEAVNDLAREILTTDRHLTISALRGNAGAGGVFLALAADRVVARPGVVLNPHYRSMGNLYGSEYWTYLLPRRIGARGARELTGRRLPISAVAARQLGMLDDCFGESPGDFDARLASYARELAEDPGELLEAKRRRRDADERERPLASYRAVEIERMKLNFYGFDPSYHVARYNFVHRIPHSRTPLHLARHR